MQVQVDVERAEDDAGQTADREDDQEGQRVSIGEFSDRAAPDGRDPAELLIVGMATKKVRKENANIA